MPGTGYLDENGNEIPDQGGGYLDESGNLKPLSGGPTEIKPQPPLWKRALQEGGGFLNELAMIPLRGAELGREVISGQAPWDTATQIERAKRMKRIEEALGAAETSGLPEQRPGRILARMVPGAVAAATTGGLSLPAQAAIQGGVQGLQSLSEGADPWTAATGAGIAGLGPVAGRAVNAAASYAKAPFAGAVDQAAVDAAQRLGVDLPASAATTSPMARNIETLSGKLIGGQGITDRATQAARALTAAAAPPAGSEALGAGTRIAEEVAGARRAAELGVQMTEAERQAFDAAQRTGRQTIEQSLSNPRLAGRAGPESAAGLSSSRRALQQAEEAIWNKADLRPVAVPAQETLRSVDELLTRGDLPPSDLAFLEKFRADIAPRKMVVIGNERLPLDQLPQEYQGIGLPVEEVPRAGNEILSQLRGLRQKVPYGAGQGVFGSEAIRKHLAGTLKGDLQSAASQANPELGQAFADANALHSGSIDAFKSPWGRQIAKLAQQGQMSKIPEVLGPNMAPEDVPRLFQAVGPDAAEALRADVLNRILGASRDAAGQVDPARVTRELAKWRGNLDQVLGPNQLADLQRLGVPIPEFQAPTAPTQGPPTAGQFLQQQSGKTIEGLYGAGQAGKVVEGVIHTKSSPQQIAAALQAAGPAADEVRANVLARVLKATGGKEVRVTPESVANEIKRWTPERLQSILTPEQYQRLQDIVTTSRAMGRASKIAEGSQTTPWLKTSEYIGAPQAIIAAILTGNPGTAAMIAGGLGTQALTSRFLGSEAGQQWLTRGFGPAVIPGSLARAGSVASSRIPSEVEMERRRKELLAALEAAAAQ